MQILLWIFATSGMQKASAALLLLIARPCLCVWPFASSTSSSSSCARPTPVFVVGASHSGTTLALRELSRLPTLYAEQTEARAHGLSLARARGLSLACARGVRRPRAQTGMFGRGMGGNERAEQAAKQKAEHEIAAITRRCENATIGSPLVRDWVEKTPKHAMVLPRLLARFPHAKVIFMVRDPRELHVSLLARVNFNGSASMGLKPTIGISNLVVALLGASAPSGGAAARLLPAGAGAAAGHQSPSLISASSCANNILLVRYEDLCSDCAAVMQRIYRFVGHAPAGGSPPGGACSALNPLVHWNEKEARRVGLGSADAARPPPPMEEMLAAEEARARSATGAGLTEKQRRRLLARHHEQLRSWQMHQPVRCAARRYPGKLSPTQQAALTGVMGKLSRYMSLMGYDREAEKVEMSASAKASCGAAVHAGIVREAARGDSQGGPRFSWLPSWLPLWPSKSAAALAPAARPAAAVAEVERGGWKTIHTFIGAQDELTGSGDRTRYYDGRSTSQAGQDSIVAALFGGKRGGYFVDLAANDAVKISNSIHLERAFGWRGVCVDGNWQYMARHRYRKCTVINAVVSARTNETVSFLERGGGGGIVSEGTDNKPGSVAARNVKSFSTVAFGEMLAYAGAPKVIDYWSLDVEGAEELVLRATPFEEYTFLVITIERPTPACHGILSAKGYVCVGTIGGAPSRGGPILDVVYMHRASWRTTRDQTLQQVAAQFPALGLNRSVCGRPLCGNRICR